MIREFTVNVVVYGDFNCLLCYLASQRADHLVGTGAVGIEWRAVERGAAPARWEQEVAQAKALTLLKVYLEHGVTYGGHYDDAPVEMRLSYYRLARRWDFTPGQQPGSLVAAMNPVGKSMAFSARSSGV